MSNNLDLIQTLEKNIAESYKSIRVLNAVKDANHFVVVTIDGQTVTSTASEGMNVSSAVTALVTAIRSYSENLDNPEDLNAIIGIVHAELSSISQRAEQLQAKEETYAQAAAYEHEEETLVLDAPSVAAKTVEPTTEGAQSK